MCDIGLVAKLVGARGGMLAHPFAAQQAGWHLHSAVAGLAGGAAAGTGGAAGGQTAQGAGGPAGGGHCRAFWGHGGALLLALGLDPGWADQPV